MCNCPLLQIIGGAFRVNLELIRDLFHVYLNKFEFNFLWLHINKTNKFSFFMHNGRVPGIVK